MTSTENVAPCYQEVLERISSKEFQDHVQKNDQDTIEYFRDIQHLKGLIDAICQENNYMIAKNIERFFQSTNTSVIELFATKLEIAEYAFLRVSEHMNYPMASGIIAHVFSKCISAFSDAISDVFRRSTKIVPLFVKMLENAAFLQVACDEASTTQYRNIPHLFYGLLQTLAGDKMEKLQDFIPEYFLLFPKYAYEIPKSINTQQFINIVQFIKTYFSNVIKNGALPFEVGLECKTFDNLIKEYIKLELNEVDPSNQEDPKLHLFDLALIFKEDYDIEKSALTFIQNSIDKATMSAFPIKYLARYNLYVPPSEILKFFAFISSSNINNTTLSLLLEMFKSIFTRSKDDSSFAQEVATTVKSVWDSRNKKMRVFLVEVTGCFALPVATQTFGEGFITKVVVPYLQTEEQGDAIPDFNITTEQFS